MPSSGPAPAVAIVAPPFDVISVKPNKDSNQTRMQFTPDGLHGIAVTVRFLLYEGFGGINQNQVAGEPPWSSTDGFDIEAKVAPADIATLGKMNFEQRRAMFQSILTERFKLVAHHETRDLPMYVLTVAKGGPKLKDSGPDDPNSTAPRRRGLMMNRGKMTGTDAQLSGLVTLLSCAELGRPIVDKTGLTGNYDFSRSNGVASRRWRAHRRRSEQDGSGHPPPPPAPRIPGASVFTCYPGTARPQTRIHQRGPVDVVVIGITSKSPQRTSPGRGVFLGTKRSAFMKLRPQLAAIVIAIIAAAAIASRAQAPAPQTLTTGSPSLPAFEVATVKPIDPAKGGAIGFYCYPGGRVHLGYANARMIVSYAYGIADYQISGGPDWVTADRYNIEAIPPDSSPSRNAKQSPFAIATTPEQRQMLQSLLRDRFALKIHTETREGEVYILSRGSKPLQLQPPKYPDMDSRGTVVVKQGGIIDGEAFGENATMSFLASQLSRDLRLLFLVLDQTGLAGGYADFHLPPSATPKTAI